jgi:hypothetical protein
MSCFGPYSALHVQRYHPFEPCKLPRPTRSLGPCGPRSLLEDGAFSAPQIGGPIPVHRRRLGFTTAFPTVATGRTAVPCTPSAEPRTEHRPCGRRWATRAFASCPLVSRRFNSRCSRALSQIWERDSNPFAVIGPEFSVRRRRSSHQGSLSTEAPPNLDVCEDSSTLQLSYRQPKSCSFGGCRESRHSLRVSPLPTRLCVRPGVVRPALVEEGAFALSRSDYISVFAEVPIVFSGFCRKVGLVTMDHFIADLNGNDVAEVEERTNTTGDNISGLLLVVF